MQDNTSARMTVKQLRNELTAWGRYWAHREYGQGHASRSMSDRLGEVRCASSAVIEVRVPTHIAHYDQQIARLSHDCRRALRVRYIVKRNWALVGFDSQKSYQYWLRRAEGELL